MWAIGCIMGEMIDGQPMFPGENEMDQLYLIQNTLGPLPMDLYSVFEANERFAGLKFPNFNNNPVENKYLGKISRKALSFLKSLLKLDPSLRLNSANAL